MIKVNYSDFLSKRFDLVIRYHLLEQVDFDVVKAEKLLFSKEYEFLHSIFRTLLEQDIVNDPFVKSKTEKSINKTGVLLKHIGAEQFFHVSSWKDVQKAIKGDIVKLIHQPYVLGFEGVGRSVKRFLIALQYKKKLYWCRLPGGKGRESWKEANYKSLLPVEWYRTFKKSQKKMMEKMYELRFFSDSHLVDRGEKTIIYIPARGGSKGIKRKNLYPLRKKPLIHYVIKTALKTMADEVWVATEDEKIKEVSARAGALVYRLPRDLTRDISPLDETMVHFAKQVQFKTIVLVQATSPLVRAEDIDRGIICFQEEIKKQTPVFDSMMSTVETDDILIWDKRERTALNYDPLERGRRQDRLSDYAIETGGFYITTRKQLLYSGCRIGSKVGFVDVPFWTSPQVDIMEDLKNIERLLGE